MIDFAQSNLLTLIAGAVIASTLLGATSFQRALEDDLALQAALDAIAVEIAAAQCSPLHPTARIDLAAALEPVRASASSVVLLDSHLRASRADGRALSSVQFPPLHILAPVELFGKGALELAFDAFDERCNVEVR